MHALVKTYNFVFLKNRKITLHDYINLLPRIENLKSWRTQGEVCIRHNLSWEPEGLEWAQWLPINIYATCTTFLVCEDKISTTVKWKTVNKSRKLWSFLVKNTWGYPLCTVWRWPLTHSTDTVWDHTFLSSLCHSTHTRNITTQEIRYIFLFNVKKY